jgi:glycosyltransferase involved in cell wall biosynthesis
MMSEPSRICLNMIVRNEAAIIERCLDSVAPAIDCYVICDTGSTDDTVARIGRFMDARGIRGEVHHTAFEDFGSARNEALDRCRSSSGAFDYILLADADMELRVGDPAFRGALAAPAYAIRQQNQLSYYNTRLVRRDVEARYVGMTHEYLSVAGPVSRLDALWFYDHACGSNRAEKFERDVRLLTRELERDPGNARAMFYLAQTYRGQGEHRQAIEWYRRRAAAGGWDEEVWYSLYALALSHLDLGEGDAFERAAREAWARRPWRAEPLHALAKHYRDSGRYDDAMTVAELGAAIPRPADGQLFVHEPVYEHGFAEEISIAGYYSEQPGRREAARAACAGLSTRRDVTAHVRVTARRNWVHYARRAEEVFGGYRVRPLPFRADPPWATFNPSLVVRDGRIEVIARASNYCIDDAGRYCYVSTPVRTRNHLLTLDDSLEPVASRALVEDESSALPGAPVAGLEDCRPFELDGRLCCVFTIRDRNPAWRCEVGFGEISAAGVVSVQPLRGYRDDVHQKNWVPLVRDGELYFVYSTDPLIVLSRDLREVARHEPPRALDHLRGSSQAVAVDGGWLYLTHDVTRFGDKRVYLHRFVLLRDDFTFAGATEAFYFLDRQTEFAPGLALLGDQLLVTFGTNDRDPWIASVPKANVLAAVR